jgi:hypothetical protein
MYVVQLAFCASALGAAVARAQPADLTGTDEAPRAESWLILTSSLADDDHSIEAPGALAAALSARLDSHKLMSGKQARTYFEQRGSSAPVAVSHSDLEALAHDAQLALYHVASGLLSQARRDVSRALLRADKALESLNRESVSARQVLDACLFLVRAHLMAHQHAEALEQALECRRRVPELQPDPKMHPPDVIGLVAEAEAELRLRDPGSLRVESEPAGCTVYVNGRGLGQAPLELPQLSPGEYRLQAECVGGEVGRVHRTVLGPGRLVKRIDPRFDSAVVTSMDVSLRYPHATDQYTHGERDAVEVGRVVGVDTVVWVHPALDDQLRPRPGLVEVGVLRVRDEALQSLVRIRVSDTDKVGSAAKALEGGKFVDLSEGEGRPLAHAERSPNLQQPPSATLDAPSRREVTSAQTVPRVSRGDGAAHGGVLAPVLVAGTGVAMLGAGAVTAVVAHATFSRIRRKCPTGECEYSGFERDQRVGKNLNTATAVLLATGSVAAATGIVWWILASRRETADAFAQAYCLKDGCGVFVRGSF